jgi:hypothetical protein
MWNVHKIYSLQNKQNQYFDFGGFFKWAHVTWYHSKQELHIILWSCWSASFEQTKSSIHQLLPYALGYIGLNWSKLMIKITGTCTSFWKLIWFNWMMIIIKKNIIIILLNILSTFQCIHLSSWGVLFILCFDFFPHFYLYIPQ